MKDNKKKTKLKKFLIGTLVPILIGVAIGAFVFGTSFGGDETASEESSLYIDLLKIAVLFTSLYVSAIIHIIAHEAGHLVCGLMTGYKFSSFRVFSVLLMKEDSKIKVKKYGIAGTGGQCIMEPPEPKENNYPYKLYNLGGGLFNLLLGALCFGLYVLLRDVTPLASKILFPFIGIGVFFAGLNLIPMKMSGIANDGYNIKELGKSVEARMSLYYGLSANAASLKGMRFKDMPPEWSRLPKNFNNPLTAMSLFNLLAVLTDKHEFGKAKELAERLLQEGTQLLELHRNELRCELMFFELIGENNHEKIKELFTKDLKAYIKASGFQLSKKRLIYTYNKLAARDENAAKKSLEEFEKICRSYPFKGELKQELELIEIVKNK